MSTVVPDDLKHDMVDVGNGVALHTVSAGAGVPVFLLHGFPQTWREWRPMLPLLAQHHEVIAVDLKGAGYSTKPASGYDKSTMAGELDALRRALGYETIQVVGHDIGGMVAFAMAARFRDTVTKVAILDAPIPGNSGWDSALTDPLLWHFAFHMKRDVPELLVQGKERQYIEMFVRDRIYNQAGITSEDIDAYAAAMAQPGAARGMFEWYRAFPQDAEVNREVAKDPLALPVLALGGDRRWGDRMVVMLKEFATDVRGGSIKNCGHWLPEERPHEVAEWLLSFLDRT
jgi:pimeloyl-ACP methyl ester carboxylesterase